MELRYDISQLRHAIWGIGASRFIRYNTSGHAENDGILYDPNVIDIKDADRQSSLGTPVEFPIVFAGGDYNYFNDGKVEKMHLKDFELPYTSVTDFSRAKKIGKTPVGARGGTVKETYSFDDWQIRIRGIMLGDGQYPEEEKAKLLAFENLADSIQIKEGELFRMKQIYALTIEQINLPSTPKFPYIQAFELICSSDEPLELII